MARDDDGEDRGVLSRSARLPDRTWDYGTDPDQVSESYLPGPGTPTRVPIVLVHGGFWRTAYDRVHLRPMAAALADRGHPVALIEYRRRPGDPDAYVEDVRAAIRSLPAELSTTAPVVVGHSAGGHLALLAAASAPIPLSGCVALAPVADLAMAETFALDADAVHAFLGGSADSRPDLDPARRPPAVPTTVVHGAEDSIVPAAIATSFCDRTGARCVLLPGVAHFEVIDPRSAVWPVILSELDALASPAGGE